MPTVALHMTEFDSSAIDEAGMAEDARAAAALRHQRTVRGDPAGNTTLSPSDVTSRAGDRDGPAETEFKPSREFNLDQFDAYHRGPLAGAARLADMSDLARMPETPNSRPEADARTLLEREWRKIFAEHATYDPMDPFGTALEAARSLTEPDDFAQTSPGETTPSSPQRRSIIDKLLGLTGERYQLWPERAVRDTLALPRDVMVAAQQYVPGRRGEDAELNDPLIERAADAAMLVMGGTFAGAPRGSLGAGPVRRVDSPASSFAARPGLMFDPPRKRRRTFEEEYPSGARFGAAEHLLVDMEGRRLIARYFVGRRVRDAQGFGLDPEEFAPLIHELARKFPTSSAPKLEKLFGEPTYTPEPFWLESLNTLMSTQRETIKGFGYELGQVIDEIVGGISIKGLLPELRGVFNTLNNPSRSLRAIDAAAGALFTPKEAGFKINEIRRVYIAEAIRAYLIDPNYLKTVAPNTARAIRAAVNGHPKLSKILQFN